MNTTLPPGDLGFLHDAPEPVQPGPRGQPGGTASPDHADVLPQVRADALLALAGVDGAWIERDARGRRFVVLHLNSSGPTAHLPNTVDGLPVRLVGGEPIRAGL